MRILINRKEEFEDEAPIPNSQIYYMFESTASDEQMAEFNTLLEKGLVHTASAYASHKVNRLFNHWRNMYLKSGGDFELLQNALWPKEKSKPEYLTDIA